MKRFDSSLEWLMGVIDPREEEIEKIGRNGEMEERERKKKKWSE